MPDARDLRRQAEQCLRLAKSINNHDVVADLEAMAREFGRQAAALDEADIALSDQISA